MMPRKKRRMLIIIMIVVLILIIGLTCLILYLNTDMFKSNKALFVKYIGKNMENLESLNNYSNEEIDYNKLLENNKYTTNIKANVNYTQNLGTTLENTNNSINKLKINIEGQVDKANQYNYQYMKLTNNEEEILGIEYIQNQNNYGLRLLDLFKQFILVENSNLKELATKIGMDEQQTEKTPEQIDIKSSINEVFNLTENERKTLQNKYANIFNQNISKDKFSKQSNVTITINDKKIQTDAYILSFSKEELNNVFIKFLETISQDEIILNKLDNLQNLIDMYGNNSEENKIKDEFVKYIKDRIEEIQNKNIGSQETKIIVYENMHNTVRTMIQTDEYEVILDYYKSGEEIYCQLSKEDLDTTLDNKLVIIYKNNGKEIDINYTNKTGEDTKTYSINQKTLINENDCTKTIKAIYEDKSNKVEANIEEKSNIVNFFKDAIELNETNSVKLNDLEQEQLSNIVDTTTESILNKFQTLETQINQNDINKVLEVIGVIKEKTTIENTGTTTEAEKNKFNTQFEMFAGESLASNNITQLLNGIKNNLAGLDVVSNSELKLKISENSQNDELLKSLTALIEKNKNKKYAVKMGYNEKTGLVESISIMIDDSK